MPFAKKFRAMMDFPFPGDQMGDFVVESVSVEDEWGHPEGYVYDVRMVLQGPGGKAGVKRTLKAFFAQHPTTFSGYGNPYQLWFRKPEVESLGDKRYAVKVKGSGARFYLEQDLDRFLAYLVAEGHLTSSDPQALLDAYLDAYKNEVKRTVSRYRGKVHRLEKAGGDEGEDDA
jgi:CubicO group peptidase (beta-lactamase class C family)